MTGTVRQHSVVGLAIPPHEAIQIARRVLATEGYQSVAVGPTAATFVRDVRPQAVTIAAYAFAVPTLGLSLFALLIRTQEQCTVTGETSRRGTGTALSLSGVVTTQTLQDLEGALRHGRQQAPVPSPDDAYGPYPTPGRAVDEASSPFPPSLLGQAPSDPLPLPPAPPRPQSLSRGSSEPLPSGPDLLRRPRRPSAFPEGFQDGFAEPEPDPYSASEPEPAPYSAAELDMTVVRNRPLLVEPAHPIERGPALPRWVVTLDDGRTIDVPDFALIGRDPEPAEDDPEAGLVSLIDPEMSVSKTHASFGVDDEGLWFLDRFSTNGTSIQLPGGERVGLEPGIATPVLPGSDVWIGRRHLKITLDDD